MPCQAANPPLEDVLSKEGHSIVRCKTRWLWEEDLSLYHLQKRIFGELVIVLGRKESEARSSTPKLRTVTG